MEGGGWLHQPRRRATSTRRLATRRERGKCVPAAVVARRHRHQLNDKVVYCCRGRIRRVPACVGRLRLCHYRRCAGWLALCTQYRSRARLHVPETLEMDVRATVDMARNRTDMRQTQGRHRYGTWRVAMIYARHYEIAPRSLMQVWNILSTLPSPRPSLTPRRENGCATAQHQPRVQHGAERPPQSCRLTHLRQTSAICTGLDSRATGHILSCRSLQRAAPAITASREESERRSDRTKES